MVPFLETDLTVLLVQFVEVYVTIPGPGLPDIIPVRCARKQRAWNVRQRVDRQPISKQCQVLRSFDLSKSL